MTDPTAGALKKLNKKELKELRSQVKPELRYLIDRVIESKSKKTGFGVYTDPAEAQAKSTESKNAKRQTLNSN